MKAVLLKEINSFFSSPIAYLVIGVFLTVNGLFLWVFEGPFNVLDTGFADLRPFFDLTPWILLSLIPALTMRSFAEERKQGTLELLFTKPLGLWKVIWGKYLASLSLVLISLAPTLLYVMTVWYMGDPEGNIDMGSTMGSYAGMVFLIAAYTAIGILASSFSDNQIVAFISATVGCFFFFFGFGALAELELFSGISGFLESLGLQAHFSSMARGVLDTRDLLYFISISWALLYLTHIKLKNI